MAGVGIGVGSGMGRKTYVTVSSSSNPNLLVFPEAFDNAIWTKTAASVMANPGDVAHPAADSIVFSLSSGMIGQTSATATTAGASVGFSAVTSGVWQRYGVTGVFDGLPYTFSVELLDADGDSIFLQLARSGGFLRCSMLDISDADPTFLAYGAKLEQSGSFSLYP